MSLYIYIGSWSMLHHHVSIVAQSGQTKHSREELSCFFLNFVATIGSPTCTLEDRSIELVQLVQFATSLLVATKSYTLVL